MAESRGNQGVRCGEDSPLPFTVKAASAVGVPGGAADVPEGRIAPNAAASSAGEVVFGGQLLRSSAHADWLRDTRGREASGSLASNGRRCFLLIIRRPP